MQNDRGHFRCYRYCSIGTGATEARGRQSSVSSLRGVLFRTSLRRIKRSDLSHINRKKRNVAHLPSVRGPTWYLVQHCHRSSSISEISPSISPTIYSMDRDSRALSLSPIMASQDLSDRSNVFTFTLNVHCVREKVWKKIERDLLTAESTLRESRRMNKRVGEWIHVLAGA